MLNYLCDIKMAQFMFRTWLEYVRNLLAQFKIKHDLKVTPLVSIKKLFYMVLKQYILDFKKIYK